MHSKIRSRTNSEELYGVGPEKWNIGGFITVSVVLGVAMVAEALLLLWIGWSRFGLATNNNALYTFSFLTLLYFAVFSIFPNYAAGTWGPEDTQGLLAHGHSWPLPTELVGQCKKKGKNS